MRAKLFPSERFLSQSQVGARQLTDQGSSDCQKNAVGEVTLYHLQRSFGNTMALSLADPQQKGSPFQQKTKSTREQAIDIFKATTNSNKKSQSNEKARSNSKKKSNKKNKSQKLTT
ncbi:MAG: hypothetical protein BYD32DRAFT_457333 [Podila humilis]|nr:MAG: hypothetical protein BYD32DRAFT_457333 [Podila humilis]